MFQTNRAQNIPYKHSRAGFTLVELLVTISIIAILASIILPAVNNARRAARIAAVRAEMSQISAALEQFKSDYGAYPPSSINLYETGADWNSTAAKSSRYLISKLWPNFNFALDRDINANSVAGETLTLTAAECLVFFLGGMTYFDTTANEYVVTGFANDPENPFAHQAATQNRTAPYFRFSGERLLDGSNNNKVPAYLDNYPDQTNPILYFSSYEGAGFNPEDCGTSGLIDVYRQSWTFATSGSVPSTRLAKTAVPTTARSWSPSSFQLVSPGPDKEYGVGGYYATGMTQPTSVGADIWGDFTTKRLKDVDNITNFSNGELR